MRGASARFRGRAALWVQAAHPYGTRPCIAAVRFWFILAVHEGFEVVNSLCDDIFGVIQCVFRGE